MNEEELTAINAVATASKVAAETSSMAASVARDVARQASDTVSNVAMIASKSAESVLLLAQDIQYIKTDVAEIKEKLKDVYVTQDQFSPIKDRVVQLEGALKYVVGIIILAVIGAVLSLVLIK